MNGDTAEKLPEVVENNIVSVDQSPLAAAERLLTAGVDLDKIEKMLELQERFERNEAKKAYTQAMTDFKSDPPNITKDKYNSHYKSRYTSLGNLVNTSLPKMSKCGLSHKWKIDQSDCITVECIVTHYKGHSESTSMNGPPDSSGSKNSIQQLKSTVTYLKSVTFESIMGLASTDANFDDDGEHSEQKPELSYHDKLAELKSADPEAYKMACEDWQVDSLEDAGTEDTQEGILKQIELYMTKEWKDWYHLRMNNYDLLETWQVPINVEQCIEAVKQAKKAIDNQNGG